MVDVVGHFKNLFFPRKMSAPDHQDWRTVVLNASKNEKQPHATTISHPTTRKLEDANGDSIPHKRYGTAYGQAVIKARLAKQWKQIDLARQLGVQLPIIRDLENGTGIVDGSVCDKVYKALKVTRKDFV